MQLQKSRTTRGKKRRKPVLKPRRRGRRRETRLCRARLENSKDSKNSKNSKNRRTNEPQQPRHAPAASAWFRKSLSLTTRSILAPAGKEIALATSMQEEGEEEEEEEEEE